MMISRAAMSRLPEYLKYLKSVEESGAVNISATTISKALGYGEVQVRKDLASVSGTGRPRTGYVTSELKGQIESILCPEREIEAVIVGAGKLGRALLGYEGFSEYGISVLTAFDQNPKKRGEDVSGIGKNVRHMSEMKDYCREHNVKIGILTVPASAAQSVCDTMTECGIEAILNFAHVRLKVPDGVTVENENLALSLAMLAGGEEKD